MNSAFVAGATGYTGRAVVDALIARGIETIAHVRPDSPRLGEWRTQFKSIGAIFDSTPWGNAEFEAVMRHYRPAYVFGLLGTTRGRARKARKRGGNDSYESVDYGLTATLLHATAARSADAKFVYLSAIGVRAGTRNPYLAVRARIEAEIEESGLTYVIARPALITGSDRAEFRFTERAAALAVRAVSGLAGAVGLKATAQRFATLDASQLARALVNSALDPDVRNVTLGVPALIEQAAR